MTGPAGLAEGLLADRYRLTERIAGGGMGEVWRAQDVVLDRPVAVKTLRAELVDDEDFRARFRAEARHAARLSHPGIASVYDFGELADRAWLVMELVDGEPLSVLLRREGTLGTDRTLDVVAQTAAALHAAHTGGVVHRDVKPGNLLVRPDGAVKVTDFGIASAADAAPLTRTGQVVGTAYYLSPEQAAGGSGTPSTDLYALGVVAYECLAGRRPFSADNPLAVVMGHLQTPPPPLPDTVPAPVRDLVERLLAKDPADRPATGALLAREAAGLREQLTDGPGTGPGLASLPVDPPAATRPDDAQELTQALPTGALAEGATGPAAPVDATGLVPVPADGTTTSRRRGAAGVTSRLGQRRAVSATALLLALLAVAFGVRGALTESVTTVPTIAVGSPEQEATDALTEADLEPVRETASSPTVAEGGVVSVRPASGTELPEGAEVVLVVSSGPPPVQVAAADLVGKTEAQARELLIGRGLVPQVASDGSGTPVGTVSSVEPTGEVALGSTVVLHVVPAPPPPPASATKAPAPAPAAPVAPAPVAPAPVAPAEEPAAPKGGKGGGGKGKGKK